MRLRLDSVIRWPGVLVALGLVGAAGCNQGGDLNKAEEKAAQEQKVSGRPKVPVYPLAGTVTVDGQAAALTGRNELLVMLYDTAKPDLPPKQWHRAVCGPDGHFAFSTNAVGDGAAPGKFVVVFTELRRTLKYGSVGPDGLKNLYNDPEKNAKEFTIDHQPPGKSDYAFDLKVSGKEAVANPGPKAVADLSDEDVKKKGKRK